MTAPTINFTVSVDTTTNPVTYTIYDSQGNPTTDAVVVTIANTIITYTLRPDSSDLQFISPVIAGDPGHDLSVNISKDGQALTIIDSNADEEDISLKLVTVPKDKVYISPDPQVKNRPAGN
ncbi:DP-EP family protein [Alteromonas sp. KUL49]|uniref:DP-EP family protein n=1 Tax=Alteromonas sp. KUL49 TaxID=2480798 RepID=UPI00102F0B6B|nr:DP-EP family protein [Alteromonas sp. KUL49]TAP34148.1 DP-EP family protein [Alteromonas sp. KUL49]GEA13635.1 hypothetical protein KUL49_40100 [Alteromonas sp. KUL49]